MGRPEPQGLASGRLGDDPDAVRRLLATDLHYPPVGGTDALRDLT